MEILSPPIMFNTALTRRLAYLESLQHHPYCADFERRAVVCYESYGFRNSKCDDYVADLTECVHGYKQAMRILAMQRERAKQYAEGSRKELYAEPPPENAY